MILQVGVGVGDGELDGVPHDDEAGHIGAVAGNYDVVGVARERALEHHVADEEAATSPLLLSRQKKNWAKSTRA